MRLIDLESSVSATVIAIHGDTLSVERLEEMGLGLGRQVVLMRRIPFGGPYIVRAGSTFIALRDSEASFIEVEPVSLQEALK